MSKGYDGEFEKCFEDISKQMGEYWSDLERSSMRMYSLLIWNTAQKALLAKVPSEDELDEFFCRSHDNEFLDQGARPWEAFRQLLCNSISKRLVGL